MTRRTVLGGALALCSLALGGCVERRYVIESDPPGALVLVNGQPLGTTPVDGYFVYYGNYNFTLIKDGFQTKQCAARIAPPWYEIPPLDFASENLYPGKLEDVHRLRFTLEPPVNVRTDELLRQADTLRQRGQTIGEGR